MSMNCFYTVSQIKTLAFSCLFIFNSFIVTISFQVVKLSTKWQFTKIYQSVVLTVSDAFNKYLIVLEGEIKKE